MHYNRIYYNRHPNSPSPRTDCLFSYLQQCKKLLVLIIFISAITTFWIYIPYENSWEAVKLVRSKTEQESTNLTETTKTRLTVTDKLAKNIYLIDSICPANGELILTPKQACAVESAAKNNPDWSVFLVTLNTWNLNNPIANVSAFKHYSNIRIWNTTLLDLAKGSFVEDFVRNSN